MENKVLDKRKEWLRIGLFILISYCLFFLGTYVFIDYKELTENPRLAGLGELMMFPPAVAMVLTRLFTKEGWKDMFLHLRLRENLKYYLLSAFLPLLCAVVQGIAVSLIYGKFSPKTVFAQISPVGIIGMLLFYTALAAALSFYALGEEIGWRSYLYPKLEKLIGTPGTIIVGGIIWGLWHIPVTLQGHNFGTDYPGFPFAGIALMCLDCICMGAFLMWLTKRTGSVFPAGIAHSCTNNVSNLAIGMFAVGVSEDLNPFSIMLILVLMEIPVGIIFTILLLRKKAEK